MKIGFTGTRHGLTDTQRAMLEGLLPAKMTEFHHGSCVGADVQAAQIVYGMWEKNGPKIICHPGPDEDSRQEDSEVDDERRAPLPHLKRNRNIVDEADELFACPFEKDEQLRGGTWFTIRYARKKGKKVTIVFPDGEIG